MALIHRSVGVVGSGVGQHISQERALFKMSIMLTEPIFKKNLRGVFQENSLKSQTIAVVSVYHFVQYQACLFINLVAALICAKCI